MKALTWLVVIGCTQRAFLCDAGKHASLNSWPFLLSIAFFVFPFAVLISLQQSKHLDCTPFMPAGMLFIFLGCVQQAGYYFANLKYKVSM